MQASLPAALEQGEVAPQFQVRFGVARGSVFNRSRNAACLVKLLVQGADFVLTLLRRGHQREHLRLSGGLLGDVGEVRGRLILVRFHRLGDEGLQQIVEVLADFLGGHVLDDDRRVLAFRSITSNRKSRFIS